MYTTTIWPIFASFGSAAAWQRYCGCVPAGVVQAVRPITPMPSRAIFRTWFNITSLLDGASVDGTLFVMVWPELACLKKLHTCAVHVCKQ